MTFEEERQTIEAAHLKRSISSRTGSYAKDKVRRALVSGKLQRPDHCTYCNKSCTPEAHHEDYTKPLDVIWICTECHGLFDRVRRAKERGDFAIPCLRLKY